MRYTKFLRKGSVKCGQYGLPASALWGETQESSLAESALKNQKLSLTDRPASSAGLPEQESDTPMSVLNPRNRLVNFRLSEAEFDTLRSVCRERGARSISEFARTAVLRSLDSRQAAREMNEERVRRIEQKVGSLEMRVDQLLNLIAMVGAREPKQPATPKLSPISRETHRY